MRAWLLLIVAAGAGLLTGCQTGTPTGRTASNIEAATTLELAEHENIVGVKEASGNLAQIGEIIRHRPARFSVLSGDDPVTLQVLEGYRSAGIPVIRTDRVSDAAARERGLRTARAPYLFAMEHTEVDARLADDMRRILQEAGDVSLGLAADAATGAQITDSMRELRRSGWEQRKAEAAKHTLPGQAPPVVALPEVSRRETPVQPGETQARAQYLNAVLDYNRAQFRLYRAIGQPPLESLCGARPHSVEVPVVPPPFKPMRP